MRCGSFPPLEEPLDICRRHLPVGLRFGVGRTSGGAGHQPRDSP
jgi:hypothetical protein